MLRGVSRLISPELMMVLMEMGHSDEIVFSDANFPAVSHAQRLVRMPGVGMLPLLEATLALLPIDSYVEQPVALMHPEPQDVIRPPIWSGYRRVLEEYQLGSSAVEYLSRKDFYERARRAFAIVATGESAMYANILLTKGVVDRSESQVESARDQVAMTERLSPLGRAGSESEVG